MIIGLGGAALVFVIIFASSFGLSDNSSNSGRAYLTEAASPPASVSSTLPAYIKIPAIGVSAPVVSVGLTSDGAMDVPKGPEGTAWFDLGPRPGEIGSAVISGHYGWKNNIPAVFDNLYKLKKGDQIYVEDERGVITTFVVRESKIYGENQNATDVFSSSDGKSRLNLITCVGAWNKARKSYSNRLVVFADKVD